MSATAKQDNNELLLKRMTELLSSGSLNEVRQFIQELYPAEIALLIESLEPEDRKVIWKLIPLNTVGEILVDLHVEVANGLIEITDWQDLTTAVESLESDDLIDLLHTLPEPLLSKVTESIGIQERRRLESALSYDDNTAGGLMSLDVLTVRADMSLDVVLRYLRKRGSMPRATDNLIVVDRNDHFQGVLPLAVLLTKNPHAMVSEVMDFSMSGIPYQMPAGEVALLFEQRDMISAPVVAEDGKVLGRITVDDIVDVIREEADHSLMSMAGLDEEQDIFAPVVTSAKRRAVWLGINLLTAFLASWVIGLFEATLDRIVALAVLMPIVASMGGIAGSQTLTLVIRGLALRQISSINAIRLFRKEIAVGAVNGALWAAVVACVAGIWFQSSSIGLLLGCAMLINLVCAALAGASIPLALQKMGIDPALAGGVLLTTVTDVIGFMAFLGLATLFLM
ncbi:magnesium transporter [Methylobacter sp. YRD-M1]|uniref:magnesium transporter n=1 Tax=Methylobacter sp. YRD-M1 TaxID=2911520 RepID=UPI00227C4BB2|nr:magnesium transporter [Methylobacter sp. YRD-M1]WAK01626.1 magnesium transporter [Methylobacter sp. YRD-M1]